jgi:hypothetical protein
LTGIHWVSSIVAQSAAVGGPRETDVAVKDAGLFAIVERIKEHYENNINNVYIRKAFSRLNVEHDTWDKLESLTGRIDVSYPGLPNTGSL